jgi:ribosome-associated toxin RatA of RatAB toxin-antitoxin module
LRHLRGAAAARTAATAEACFDLVTALEKYPSWYPDVVRGVSALRRGPDGHAIEADVTLRLAIGPLKNDYGLRMAVSRRRGDEVILTRLPDDESDQEQFRVTWRFGQDDAFTDIRLEIDAYLDVPRMVPLGGLGDRLAAGFIEAACNALESPEKVR